MKENIKINHQRIKYFILGGLLLLSMPISFFVPTLNNIYNMHPIAGLIMTIGSLLLLYGIDYNEIHKTRKKG